MQPNKKWKRSIQEDNILNQLKIQKFLNFKKKFYLFFLMRELCCLLLLGLFLSTAFLGAGEEEGGGGRAECNSSGD